MGVPAEPFCRVADQFRLVARLVVHDDVDFEISRQVILRRGQTRRHDLALRSTLRFQTDYEGGKQEAEVPARVYRLDPRRGALEVVAEDFYGPNGLCFSPDGNARTRGVKVNDIECTRQVLRVDLGRDHSRPGRSHDRADSVSPLAVYGA
jgi:hypothetical protein